MELAAGKVAVVTGAASGIGLALAERFARAGLDVVLADVEQPALQAASEKVAGVGSHADPWFGPLSAWQWVLGVNLWGVIHGIRAFLPPLAAQGQGHIVNTA